MNLKLSSKLLLILLLTGCSRNSFNVYTGFSFNDERSGKPEIDGLVSPLGILRVEYETERENIGFCEHVSSISVSEKGYGLNHCGFLFKL